MAFDKPSEIVWSRLTEARIYLRSASAMQGDIPPSQRIDFTRLVGHLEVLIKLVRAGDFGGARKLHEDYSTIPHAEWLGSRKKSKVEKPSAKKSAAARVNGRKRASGSGWHPLEIEPPLSIDGGRWQHQQAVALLTAIQSQANGGEAKSTALAAVVNHTVSVRVERAIFHLLPQPQFGAARDLLPSRWRVRPSKSQLKSLTRRRIKFLRQKAAAFCDDKESQTVVLEVWKHGANTPTLYGTFRRANEIEGPVDVYDATRVCVRIDGISFELPIQISKEQRQLRQMVRKLVGPKKRILVRLFWRGSSKEAKYGPFASAAKIAVPWSHLQESEVFVRAVDSPPPDEGWVSIPLPLPKRVTR